MSLILTIILWLAIGAAIGMLLPLILIFGTWLLKFAALIGAGVLAVWGISELFTAVPILEEAARWAFALMMLAAVCTFIYIAVMTVVNAVKGWFSKPSEQPLTPSL